MNLSSDKISKQQIYEKLNEAAQTLNLCALSIIPSNLASYGQKSFDEKHKNGIPEDLSYLQNNQNVRNNPELLLEGTKNIVSVALLYRQNSPISDSESQGIISMYALGRDYHKTLKNKLNALGAILKQFFPNIKFRAIVDSAPFYEQFFAESGEIGTIGRNGLIRIPNIGSMIFLGELLIDVDITENNNIVKVFPNDISKIASCPTSCNQCITNCPTKALTENGFYVERCISFLTIEYKGNIPLEFWSSIGKKIYGCDTCQIFCPFNKYCSQHNSAKADSDFNNRYDHNFLEFGTLLELTEEQFFNTFVGSPIRRIGYYQFMRNVCVACTNTIPQNTYIQKMTNLLGKNETLDWHIKNAITIIKKKMN